MDAFTLKQRVLNAADAMIANAEDDVRSYVEQPRAFTDQEWNNLQECQRHLARLVRFRKAFHDGISAGPGRYCVHMLGEIVDFINSMEDDG
jgi:hypothetical protein